MDKTVAVQLRVAERDITQAFYRLSDLHSRGLLNKDYDCTLHKILEASTQLNEINTKTIKGK